MFCFDIDAVFQHQRGSLKNFAEELAPVTHDIALCFTSSIIEGKYLALCKHALVSPIPKLNPLK